MAAGLVGLNFINKGLFNRIYGAEGISNAAAKVLSALPKELDDASDRILDKLAKATSDKKIRTKWKKTQLSDKEILITNTDKNAAIAEYGNLSKSPDAPIRKTINDDPLDRKQIMKKLQNMFAGR